MIGQVKLGSQVPPPYNFVPEVLTEKNNFVPEVLTEKDKNLQKTCTADAAGPYT